MRQRSGYLDLTTCGLIWGSIGVLVKRTDLPAPAIVFFRLALGAGVVIGWAVARRRMSSLRLGPKRWLVFATGAGLAGHWVLLFEAFKRLDVATTILIVYLGPVLIALGARPVLGEALERRTIGSLALAVGGIVLIAARGIGHLDRVGLAEALLAAISFAALVLAGKRLRDFYEPPALVAWQLGTAAVLLFPALASASPARVWHAAPTLLALGVVHTGIAGILYFRALGVVRAQHAGILAYLEPATAVVYAWIFLGETPGWQTLLGGVLIIGAGVNIVLGARRRSGAPVAAPEAAA